MSFPTASRQVLAVAAILFLISASSLAQEFRGTIIGTVSDSTGAVLPGVTVTVTNTETHVTQTVVTDAQGLYQVRYLNPGTYSVTAELQGFKKFSRIDNNVRVGDVLRIDIALETGGMTETVEVTAEPPLLNTNSGVSGTTIDSKQIAELPLGDGTAYMLTRLAPGIMDSSDLHFARPADNGNLAGIVANGVQGGNEFTIDLSGFYFHDSQVQTGGVDNPALQRADQRIQLGNNVRYFPSTLPNVRTDNLHLMDLGLYKNFQMPNRMKLQIRVEAINALNYTVLWNPNVDPRNATFGFINQDRNNPRDIQIGARFTF